MGRAVDTTTTTNLSSHDSCGRFGGGAEWVREFIEELDAVVEEVSKWC